MPNKDESFNFFEDLIKKNKNESIKQSIDYYKGRLPELEEKVKGGSAIKHTMSLLDTDVINQQIIQDSFNNGYNQENGQSQGQSNENVKVRTIGARTDMPIHTKPSVPESNDLSANYGQPGLSNGTYEEIYNNRMSGFTDLLILVGTGFLVLLVFVVSYLMLNYFG